MSIIFDLSQWSGTVLEVLANISAASLALTTALMGKSQETIDAAKVAYVTTCQDVLFDLITSTFTASEMDAVNGNAAWSTLLKAVPQLCTPLQDFVKSMGQPDQQLRLEESDIVHLITFTTDLAPLVTKLQTRSGPAMQARQISQQPSQARGGDESIANSLLSVLTESAGHQKPYQTFCGHMKSLFKEKENCLRYPDAGSVVLTMMVERMLCIIRAEDHIQARWGALEAPRVLICMWELLRDLPVHREAMEKVRIRTFAPQQVIFQVPHKDCITFKSFWDWFSVMVVLSSFADNNILPHSNKASAVVMLQLVQTVPFEVMGNLNKSSLKDWPMSKRMLISLAELQSLVGGTEIPDNYVAQDQMNRKDAPIGTQLLTSKVARRETDHSKSTIPMGSHRDLDWQPWPKKKEGRCWDCGKPVADHGPKENRDGQQKTCPFHRMVSEMGFAILQDRLLDTQVQHLTVVKLTRK